MPPICTEPGDETVAVTFAACTASVWVTSAVGEPKLVTTFAATIVLNPLPTSAPLTLKVIVQLPSVEEFGAIGIVPLFIVRTPPSTVGVPPLHVVVGARGQLLQAERHRFVSEQWPTIRATIERLGLTLQDLPDVADARKTLPVMPKES